MRNIAWALARESLHPDFPHGLKPNGTHFGGGLSGISGFVIFSLVIFFMNFADFGWRE